MKPEKKKKKKTTKSNLLITGAPGVGKTTVLQSLLETIALPVRGFYTAEVREQGRRVGFALHTLEGDRHIFAHVNFRTRFRVGRYGVRVDILDDWGVTQILAGIEEEAVLVIDEIGKMELFSQAFREAVIQALDSPSPVIATLTRHRAAYTEKVRNREDVQIARVTMENRDGIVLKIMDYLKTVLGKDAFC
jgi:nucleoside-triphosphatase